MERNEPDNAPAAQKQDPTGSGTGSARRTGSNKVVIAIWVVLLLGGSCWLAYSRQKNAAEAERLLNESYTLYGQRDFEASTESLRQSAELGNAWAQLYYGERLKTGFYTEQNMAEAVKWLRKAAQKKNFEACYQLGVCYENGEGVERNLDEAEAWYRRALNDPAFASSAQESLDRIANRKAENAAGSN
jgi:tetratricopeptide (TPR) repeat protein